MSTQLQDEFEDKFEHESLFLYLDNELFLYSYPDESNQSEQPCPDESSSQTEFQNT
ncbi:31665_t:CDS:2, partial [Racocetra persica]